MMAMSMRPVITISLSTSPKLSLMKRWTLGYSWRTAFSKAVDSDEVVL